MEKKQKLPLSSVKWIFYISRRFSQVDRKGRSRVTSILASLGIAFGVMALIVIISVMNGFQLGYIESILEISSYHIRMTAKDDQNGGLNPAEIEKLEEFVKNNGDFLSITPFYEGQSLVASSRGKQQGALIRAVSANIMQQDDGFAKEVEILAGDFDLSQPNYAVLGVDLAYSLGAHVGDDVNFLALSGGSDVALLSDNRQFTVTGIFSCAYADINASYVFVSSEKKELLFGANAVPTYGIKLKNADFSQRYCSVLKNKFPSFNFESWANYNRSFFGVLKVEKNMLMLLVLLIFVVVGVNIYNGLRRMVFSRKEEICILAALGAKFKQIRMLFVMQGFLCGILGALPGAVMAIIICHNMDFVFTLIGKVSYFFQYVFTLITAPSSAKYLVQNSLYSVFASIPPRIVFGEVFTITLFGVLSAVFAAWAASRGVLRYSLADVLHDE